MPTVQDIEKAVAELPRKELAQFREWFEEFDAATWDRQFEEDVQSGKLEKIAGQALEDYEQGKFKEL